jgi:oligopeptide/dipeptide ABC transporter ATP-binding protein
MTDAASPVLELRDLTIELPVHRGPWRRSARIRPVDGVSLAVAVGETVGLVGESGCGKSTLARAAVGLWSAHGGSVRVDGRDLAALRGAELRAARRLTQLIGQDPGGALDPRQTVGAALAEALAARTDGGPDGVAEARRLLEEVGLPPGAASVRPHELSGGGRQRVAIARALAVAPRVLIADEPVSALDAPLRARILNLLREAQQRRGLGLLLIAHDPRLVERLSGRVAVMYLGRLVEVWPTGVGAAPCHPYTRALLAATPTLAGALAAVAAGEAPAVPSPGEPPSFLDPPDGCAYAPRCALAEEGCRRQIPPLVEIATGHLLRCPPAQR